MAWNGSDGRLDSCEGGESPSKGRRPVSVLLVAMAIAATTVTVVALRFAWPRQHNAGGAETDDRAIPVPTANEFASDGADARQEPP